MGERIPDHERAETPKDEHLETVLRTAKMRAAFTRKYLADRERITGKPMDYYLGAIQKLGVNVDASDDRSLTQSVYDAQTKLGFAKTLDADGCDGMLGPNTLSALMLRTDQTDAPRTPQAPQAPQASRGAPQASPDSRPPENVSGGIAIARNTLPEETRYDPSQVATFGDSYGVGFFIAGDRKGYKEGNVKSGRRLASIKAGDTKSTEHYAMQACEDPNVQVINLLGGRNDMYILTNKTGSNAENVARNVVASFDRIIEAAHKNGKRVVVYTIAYKTVPEVTPREAGIRRGLDIINAGLMAGKADVIIDKRDVDPSLITKDGLHMKSYRPLVAALQQATGMA